MPANNCCRAGIHTEILPWVQMANAWETSQIYSRPAGSRILIQKENKNKGEEKKSDIFFFCVCVVVGLEYISPRSDSETVDDCLC